MPKGHIVCYTCDSKILQEFEAPDSCTLLAMAETAILDNHVCAPHSASHDLRAVVQVTPRLTPKKPLRIECFHRNCNREVLMETECERELVSAAVIAFHASHEGHMIRVRYGTDIDAWEIESPGITPQLLKERAELRKKHKLPEIVPRVV